MPIGPEMISSRRGGKKSVLFGVGRGGVHDLVSPKVSPKFSPKFSPKVGP